MNDVPLFDAGPSVYPVEPERLSSDRRRTLHNNALIAAGKHPATKLPLRAEGGSCGSCAHHRITSNGGNRHWHKCGLVAATAGPGTDIRASWPACIRWEADQP